MTQVSVSTKGGAGESGITGQLLGYVVTWILPVLASLLIIWLALSLTDFYYQHAWVSAHYSDNRAFLCDPRHHRPSRHTNPELRSYNDPAGQLSAFAAVLLLRLEPGTRAFPDSIRAMHLFMAVIAIANAYVMWLIASMFFKPRVAIVCGSAFLLLPATLRYGLLLLPANLAMLGVSVALLFMLRYLQSADAGRERLWDLGLSAFAFFLACITSWEPFLALPGTAARLCFRSPFGAPEDMLLLGNRGDRGRRKYAGHLFAVRPHVPGRTYGPSSRSGWGYPIFAAVGADSPGRRATGDHREP